MNDVHIHDRRRLLDDFLSVDEVRLQFRRHDGRMSRVVRRLSLERGDAAAAVLYERRSSRVILVRQFRYSTLDKGPGWMIEALAGVVEPGEDPRETVRREAFEELGYRIAALEPVAQFYLSPGGSSERVHLFCAEVEAADRVEARSGAADEDEDIQPFELALADVPQAIADGTLCDAKTLVGVLWLLRRHAPGG